MNSFLLLEYFRPKIVIWFNSTKLFFPSGSNFMAIMKEKQKHQVLVEFGIYLKTRRETILKETNLLQFSYSSNFDNSKLAKIEKGEIDIQFSTLIEIAKAYKLADKEILGFKFLIDE